MNPIDNSNLVHLGQEGSPYATFDPAVSYTYDVEAKTVDVWDVSTFADGDGLKKAHIRVCDTKGDEVRGTVLTTLIANKITVNVATLDASRGLSLIATVVCNSGLIADGSFTPIVAAGDLENWDKNDHKFPA